MQNVKVFNEIFLKFFNKMKKNLDKDTKQND